MLPSERLVHRQCLPTSQTLTCYGDGRRDERVFGFAGAGHELIAGGTGRAVDDHIGLDTNLAISMARGRVELGRGQTQTRTGKATGGGQREDSLNRTLAVAAGADDRAAAMFADGSSEDLAGTGTVSGISQVPERWAE